MRAVVRAGTPPDLARALLIGPPRPHCADRITGYTGCGLKPLMVRPQSSVTQFSILKNRDKPRSPPAGKDLHLIADKHATVKRWLKRHPRFTFTSHQPVRRG
jgi:hypothetical protein